MEERLSKNNFNKLTPYHIKYFANVLTKQSPSNDIEKLSMSLFDATVDINPHQVEAALFAFKSPLSKGVILADEVGLGKTIEAGLVLCQYWAERKRKLLVICPSSLRKQWSLELKEKFNLTSMILENKIYNDEKRSGKINPFEQKDVIITSFNFANNKKADIRQIAWDVVIIDEAHKLRNVYRNSNKIGQGIKWAIEDKKKLLLTATPLQNSLLELYGLSTLIDERIFGDIKTFRLNYINDENYNDLRYRLKGFCKRTLRKDVLEYIKYTERHAVTQTFEYSNEEQELYENISEFLQRDDTYAIPKSQRTLTTLILRKLLASSTRAIEQTLETIKARLLEIKEGIINKNDIYSFVSEDDLISIEEEREEEKELIEFEEDDETDSDKIFDVEKINIEIAEIDKFIGMAKNIKIDTKSDALIKALNVGFNKMNELGGNKKALIFTESRRTQEYLKQFLESNRYKEKVVIFNGTNSDKESNDIYNKWIENNKNSGRISGSKTADRRNAIIEHFRDNAEIMIATESASEGVNLQFCSLVVNYDLPWNPQRIEQRIGRCHRYGQKFDVVVINFLNTRNQADRRVYELLNEKFKLFEGVMGSSDEVLGTIESGIDFERKILNIYQSYRKPEEIEKAFKELQKEMEEKIQKNMIHTRQQILENFDIDVHERLKLNLEYAKKHLDKYSRLFWSITEFVLDKKAEFNNIEKSFYLKENISRDIEEGKYFMVSKEKKNIDGKYLYRLSHPLGEYVVNQSVNINTPPAKVVFDITNNPFKISVIEKLKGKQGYLKLLKLSIESFEKEEYMLFSGITEDGILIDQDICDKLFQCSGKIQNLNKEFISHEKLCSEMKRLCEATISKVIDENNKYFREEQEKLQKWSDDLILTSEKQLDDVKGQIRDYTRKVRYAESTEEQHEYQAQIIELEKQKKQLRRRIFEVEDEVMERRDELIKELEQRLNQKVQKEELFTIGWEII